jgi:hypothetical protein
MRAGALLDSGALVALLDRDDGWHRATVEAVAATRLPLLISEAVLTEALYLLGLQHQEAVWRLWQSGALRLAEISDKEIPRLAQLMKTYRDRPMDFADATLVYLAEREGIADILTIDHNDFETYRIRGRKRFRILPARGSR